ncbi:MAG TPA: hypothetical protein VK001_04635 [Geminicoccaceae bacterium]|nr:hypothetical protein [Geminicoccaceae bacterium]
MANSQPETPRPLAPHELQARLQRFTGSETFYTHFTGRLIYTEGVHYLAEHAGAYWLIDAIASWQTEPKVRAAPFQVWRLTVTQDRSAVLEVAEDHDERGHPVHARNAAERAAGHWTRGPLARQAIPWTDFPLDTIDLWVCRGVLMLPSEY